MTLEYNTRMLEVIQKKIKELDKLG